ncbi:protein draper-like [Euwallacea similis]|uniref:protein draper-like n=1 Tax=Euwallacea similis TaxID=1736056 RepID=UPI00344B7E0F
MGIPLLGSFALLALNIFTSLAKLEGDNMCLKIVNYPEEQVVVDEFPYDERICPENSSTCVKIENRTVKKVQHIIRWKEIMDCCEGYSKNLAENLCVPECNNGCFNGNCIAPNKCQCNQGFGGENCDITCPNGRYGQNCSNICDCPVQAHCDPFNGNCHCNPGFTGNFCEDQCVSGTYGINCTEKCKCENGYCHHVTGSCQCHPGYTGYSCDKPCLNGYYGEYCGLKCNCQNSNETCNHISGTCICNDGWIKSDCSQKCPKGFWGKNCIQRCHCSTGFCNHNNGTCIYSPGWAGIRCLEKCEECTGLKLCDPGDNCNIVNVLLLAIIIGCIVLVVISIIAVGCYYIRKNGWVGGRNVGCVPASNFMRNLFRFTKREKESFQDQTRIEGQQRLSIQSSKVATVITFVENSQKNNAPNDIIYSEIEPEYDNSSEYECLNHTGPINPYNSARYMRL